MKRTFPCGHKGKGKYCHRCEQEAKSPPIPKAPAPKPNRRHVEDDPYTLKMLDGMEDYEPRPDWRENVFGEIRKRGWNH